MLTALALVPAAAHLFALPNRIGLDSARYFTVQGIYRGWSMFGFMLLGALVANLGLALLLRRRPVPFALALTGFLLIATTLAVFFIWVYPANQATANWTTAPEDWERLRRLWECGHAAMPLTFLALDATTAAALLDRPWPPWLGFQIQIFGLGLR